MKFKMAPNSLFAVLLRSPWWISIGIALVFAAGSKALLPDQFWIYGAMGAIPIFVIGLIALWRQLKAPSSKRVAAILQAVGAMSWRDFADVLEKAYARDGFSVERIDGAADFALTRGGRTTLVCAKRWKAARQGEEALAALHKAAGARDASECVYVALGELSANAQRFAKDNSVQLVQSGALVLLLRDMPA